MSPRRALALAFTLSLGACATARPVAGPTVATLGSKGTIVDTIDARNVRDERAGARFEIQPGRHTIEVSLATERPPVAPGEPEVEIPVITVCFTAEAGHSYLTRAVVEQKRWRPEIIDEETGAVVTAQCEQPREPPEVAEAPATTPPDPPAATEATEAPVAPAPEPTEVTKAPEVAKAPPAAAPEPPKTSAPTSLPVPALPMRREEDRPGTGVGAAIGFFFGGDSLFDATFTNAPDRSLTAGRGVLIAVGGIWTPLWATDSVGFGVGGSLGWKYDAIGAQNGSISLTRFPLTASVHSLIRFDSHWFTLLSGGLVTDVAGRLSGDGFADGIDTDVESGLGLFVEGGLHYYVKQVDLGASLRYSIMKAEVQGNKIDAGSFGIIGSGAYCF